MVSCGCFFGTTEDFLKQVKSTHGENKYSKQYHMITDLALLKLNT